MTDPMAVAPGRPSRVREAELVARRGATREQVASLCREERTRITRRLAVLFDEARQLALLEADLRLAELGIGITASGSVEPLDPGVMIPLAES